MESLSADGDWVDVAEVEFSCKTDKSASASVVDESFHHSSAVLPSSSEKWRTNPSFAVVISSAAYVAADMGSLRSGAHSGDMKQRMQ